MGKNAQGKTSFLESLSLITQLKSFRTNSVSDLINDAYPQASVQAFVTEPTASKVLIGLEANRKLIRIDEKKVAGRSKYDFLGSGISFVPDDLHLVKGGPEARRSFFDELAVSVDAGNDRALQNFQKTLKQRNRLIKSVREGKAQLSHLSLWTQQFIESSIEVYKLRRLLVGKCAQLLPHIYNELFNVNESLRIHYETGFESEFPDFDEIAQRIGRLGEAEIAAGYSLVGPHRDDYIFELQSRGARSFASQGQTRGIVIALKVCQMELSKESPFGVPILLLDDIISELDESRVRSLVNYLSDYPGQLFVSTAETAKLKTLHQQFPSFKLIDLENELLKPSERPLNLSS